MAVNHFDVVIVWSNLGGAVRVNPGGKATLTDPSTGALVTVVQDGSSVTTITADENGRASFTADPQGILTLNSGGLSMTVVSAEQATAGAANAALAQDAQAAAESARDTAVDAARSVAVNASDYATLQDAVDALTSFAPTRTVKVRGTWNITTAVTIPAGTILDLDATAEIVLSAASTTPAIQIAGTVAAAGSPTATLAADAAAGATTITVSSSTGISTGTTLLIGDDTYDDPTQPTRRAGEIVRVASVSGTTVTLYRPLRLSYATSKAAGVWKITEVAGVTIRGGKISRAAGGTANGNGLIDATAAAGMRIIDTEITGNAGPGIQIVHCRDVQISGVNAHDLDDDQANGKYGYGVNIGACDGVLVERCQFRRVRHGVTTNGSSHHGHPMGVVVSACTATATTNSAFDTHAAGYDVTFDGCLAYDVPSNGFTVRSRSTRLKGCTASNTTAAGFLIAETVATDVELNGCTSILAGTHGFHVNSDGPSGLRFIGCVADRSATNGLQIASGCNDVLVKDCTVLNAGQSASQGNGLQGVGTTAGTGWTIIDNLFAKTGAAGTYRSAVFLPSAVTGSYVADNKGWGTRTDLAFVIDSGGNRLRNNVRLDQGTSVVDGTAAPTTGTWKVGDQVRNSSPTAGGNMGWVCVTAGTPGTWKSFGSIAA